MVAFNFDALKYNIPKTRNVLPRIRRFFKDEAVLILTVQTI